MLALLSVEFAKIFDVARTWLTEPDQNRALFDDRVRGSVICYTLDRRLVDRYRQHNTECRTDLSQDRHQLVTLCTAHGSEPPSFQSLSCNEGKPESGRSFISIYCEELMIVINRTL